MEYTQKEQDERAARKNERISELIKEERVSFTRRPYFHTDEDEEKFNNLVREHETFKRALFEKGHIVHKYPTPAFGFTPPEKTYVLALDSDEIVADFFDTWKAGYNENQELKKEIALLKSKSIPENVKKWHEKIFS